MRILVDTNLLVRITHFEHVQHPYAIKAIIDLKDAGHELCLVPQVIYEYWAVVTRPLSQNGMSESIEDAKQNVEELLNYFTLHDDEPRIFDNWFKLVSEHDVKGKPTHDARLVAAMQLHQLQYLLTFNASDFKRFPDIIVLDPQSLTLPIE